jgi:hypothetical protein
LEPDPADLEVRRNMAITQPLLWIARPEEVPLLKTSRKNWSLASSCKKR